MTNRQTDKQTDMTNPIVSVRKFSGASKKYNKILKKGNWMSQEILMFVCPCIVSIIRN